MTVAPQCFTPAHIRRENILTAAQWSHLSVLRVDLRDVSNSLTQHVHWDLVTVLVLPVGGLVASSLDLGSAVSWNRSEQQTEGELSVSAHLNFTDFCPHVTEVKKMQTCSAHFCTSLFFLKFFRKQKHGNTALFITGLFHKILK